MMHDAANHLQLNPGQYVCLSVSDDGEGMDQETLSKAVEPFFTTKGVGKGTGLGLSMVDGMAAQSRGRLILKSQKGMGTTATICLPVADVGAATIAATSSGLAATVGSAGPLRVLVVDDDAIVLFNTSIMLEELGHRPIEAHSGAAALAVLEREPVDLLITDQAMPQMTGLDLGGRARQIHPHLPIILATGYADLAGNEEPAIVLLPKPFSMKDLSEAIAKVANERRVPLSGGGPFLG
jgi:CheY-like chemotaxis protein